MIAPGRARLMTLSSGVVTWTTATGFAVRTGRLHAAAGPAGSRQTASGAARTVKAGSAHRIMHGSRRSTRGHHAAMNSRKRTGTDIRHCAAGSVLTNDYVKSYAPICRLTPASAQPT